MKITYSSDCTPKWQTVGWATYRAYLHAGWQWHPHWVLRAELGYQSVGYNMDYNFLAGGGNPKQQTCDLSLAIEYTWHRWYLSGGVHVAYECNHLHIIQHSGLIVRASQWHGGPTAGIGYILPINEYHTLRIGAQGTWAFLRYYDTMDQIDISPQDRTYNHTKVISNYQLVVQYSYQLHTTP